MKLEEAIKQQKQGVPLILNCSFGKDSLALLITLLEMGVRPDRVVYGRIMFDKEISAELPEHETFIYHTAIPALKERYGINVEIYESKYNFYDTFYRIVQSGANKGTIYGWPLMRGAWCNSRLKVTTLKQVKGINIIGIASDEHKRIDHKINKQGVLPLVEMGMTEGECACICKAHGLYSPAYRPDHTRLGCWFCNKQRLSDLEHLCYKYPDFYAKLELMEADSNRTFRPGMSLSDLRKALNSA